MGAWGNTIRDLIATFLGSGRKIKAAELRVVQGTIAEAIDFLEGLQRGAKIIPGLVAPSTAVGIDGDAYINMATGDFFVKDGGQWGTALSLPGKPGDPGKPGKNGITPVKGRDYFDGVNGKSNYELWQALGNTGTVVDYLATMKGEPGKDGVVGNGNHFEAYAPTNEPGTPGDAWFFSVNAQKMEVWVCTASGVWSKRFASPDPGASTTGGGNTNGVTLIGNGDGTKYLANDGTYKTVASGPGGAAVTVDADLTTNPASPTNAASVKAVNEGLTLKLDKAAKATAADIATGTDNTKYITAQAYTESTQDFSTYLQDLPAAVISNITNGANWNPDNRYTGPAIPNGLTMKIYYSYPADPTLPAYEFRFWPGNKVVRVKCTN